MSPGDKMRAEVLAIIAAPIYAGLVGRQVVSPDRVLEEIERSRRAALSHAEGLLQAADARVREQVEP